MPLHLVGGYTVPIFPNKRFWGFTCPALAHVGCYLMYLLSWAWLTNAPMPQRPQPLSVFDCVVKAKYFGQEKFLDLSDLYVCGFFYLLYTFGESLAFLSVVINKVC